MRGAGKSDLADGVEAAALGQKGAAQRADPYSVPEEGRAVRDANTEAVQRVEALPRRVAGAHDERASKTRGR